MASKARISVIEFDVISVDNPEDISCDIYYGLLLLGGNLIFKHDVTHLYASGWGEEEAENETLRVFSEKLSKLLETV